LPTLGGPQFRSPLPPSVALTLQEQGYPWREEQRKGNPMKDSLTLKEQGYPRREEQRKEGLMKERECPRGRSLDEGRTRRRAYEG